MYQFVRFLERLIEFNKKINTPFKYEQTRSPVSYFFSRLIPYLKIKDPREQYILIRRLYIDTPLIRIYEVMFIIYILGYIYFGTINQFPAEFATSLSRLGVLVEIKGVTVIDIDYFLFRGLVDKIMYPHWYAPIPVNEINEIIRATQSCRNIYPNSGIVAHQLIDAFEMANTDFFKFVKNIMPNSPNDPRILHHWGFNNSLNYIEQPPLREGAPDFNAILQRDGWAKVRRKGGFYAYLKQTPFAPSLGDILHLKGNNIYKQSMHHDRTIELIEKIQLAVTSTYSYLFLGWKMIGAYAVWTVITILLMKRAKFKLNKTNIIYQTRYFQFFTYWFTLSFMYLVFFYIKGYIAMTPQFTALTGIQYFDGFMPIITPQTKPLFTLLFQGYLACICVAALITINLVIMPDVPADKTIRGPHHFEHVGKPLDYNYNTRKLKRANSVGWVMIFMCMFFMSNMQMLIYAPYFQIPANFSDLSLIGNGENFYDPRLLNFKDTISIFHTGYVDAVQLFDKTQPFTQRITLSGISPFFYSEHIEYFSHVFVIEDTFYKAYIDQEVYYNWDTRSHYYIPQQKIYNLIEIPKEFHYLPIDIDKISSNVLKYLKFK